MMAISILCTLNAYEVQMELHTKPTSRHRQLRASIRRIFSAWAMFLLQKMVFTYEGKCNIEARNVVTFPRVEKIS